MCQGVSNFSSFYASFLMAKLATIIIRVNCDRNLRGKRVNSEYRIGPIRRCPTLATGEILTNGMRGKLTYLFQLTVRRL